MFHFSSPLASISGVGPRFIQKFKRLGIETVEDLLRHIPKRYEDFSRVTQIGDIIAREECTVRGEIKSIDMRRAWKRRMFITEAIISDGTGSIRAVWFNQTYIKNTLIQGKIVNLSGKVSASKDGELYLSNPGYEIVSGGRETKHTARVVPIYPETKGLTSKGIRYILKPILDGIEKSPEFLPQSIIEKYGLLSADEALKTVHFPDSIESALEAKRRLTFDDLFLLELFLLGEKAEFESRPASAINAKTEEIKKLIEPLPFALTDAQKKALWEIVKDIREPHPMNRLLQGDVGSGKTIVAAVTAILTAKDDFQVAFMAPTEILARQHYETIRKFFPEYGGGLALVTGNESRVYYGSGLESEIKKPEVKKELEKNKIKIAVGTHALIAEGRRGNGIEFPNLALLVIDEQHRFGVRQRARLLEQPKGKPIPHFLSMSATPIPRTLSLTIWSDLDLSLINELPKNRKEIVTKAVSQADRKNAYEFIKKEIEKGRQAFVVCPRIEPEKNDDSLTESEKIKLEIKSVKEEYEKLSKKVFPNLKIEMLHGKMPGKSGANGEKSKEEIMRKFKNREIDILIATSVIEVGIDVPNATIMMIEGAERFGLAQLYQFRGRVGRGEHQSYCFLFSESSSENTNRRLKAIVSAKNGFELAEADLKIRGPGAFLGAEQTGMPDLAMRALENPKLAEEAKSAALSLLSLDPKLEKHESIKKRVESFSSKIHDE